VLAFAAQALEHVDEVGSQSCLDHERSPIQDQTEAREVQERPIEEVPGREVLVGGRVPEPWVTDHRVTQ
jgi:hypothetical protein